MEVIHSQNPDWFQRKIIKFKKQHWAAKLFIIVAVVEVIILQALVVNSFVKFLSEENTVRQDCHDPSLNDEEVARCEAAEWYEASAFIFLCTSLWMLYFAVHGIMEANLSELIAFFLATALLTTFAIITIVGGHLKLPDYIEVCAILIPQLLYLILSYTIRKEYRWKFFKKVGGDPEFRALYKTLQGFKAAIKLDMLFGFILVLASGIFSVEFNGIDVTFGVLMAVATIATFIAGYFGVTKENRKLMIAFFVLSVLEPLYIAYKIERFVTSNSVPNIKTELAQFTITAVGALTNRIILVVFAAKSLHNFDKGLKDLQFLKLKRKSRMSLYQSDDVIQSLINT